MGFLVFWRRVDERGVVSVMTVVYFAAENETPLGKKEG